MGGRRHPVLLTFLSVMSALDSVAGTLIVIALCAAALLLLKYDARKRAQGNN